MKYVMLISLLVGLTGCLGQKDISVPESLTVAGADGKDGAKGTTGATGVDGVGAGMHHYMISVVGPTGDGIGPIPLGVEATIDDGMETYKFEQTIPATGDSYVFTAYSGDLMISASFGSCPSSYSLNVEIKTDNVLTWSGTLDCATFQYSAAL